MHRIKLRTEKTKDGFVARCNLDGQELQTAPREHVTNAIDHLISVVNAEKAKKNQVRNVHYIFKI